jgi:hypothetical protein
VTTSTEQDIRDALADRQARYPKDGGAVTLRRAVGETFDLIRYDRFDDPVDGPTELGDYLWRDLTPSQAARLRQLVTEAEEAVYNEARALITDRLVRAASQFAAEHADAPRAKPQLIGA